MSSANMQLVRVAAFRSQAVIIPQQQLVRPAALVIYLVIYLLIAYLLTQRKPRCHRRVMSQRKILVKSESCCIQTRKH